MREREGEVFDILSRKLGAFSFPGARIVEKEISPEIERHPAYTQLHFTKTAQRPSGLPATEAYRGRCNLLYLVDGEFSDAGRNTAVNAHIDVVAPFFPPERKGEYICGRGTADDKGNIAVIYGALSVIDRLAREKVIGLKNKITAMLVIEEEPGGNGSLSIAADRELKERYDSVLILETAGNNVYPANRGAVWFKCELSLPGSRETVKREGKVSLLESIIFAIIEMQVEGDNIKAESDHPLFPHKPVQTCNGMLGPFGEHPSRICGEVSFVLRGVKNREELSKVKSAVDSGLDDYIKKYGDKTKSIDPATGRKKVDRHVDVGCLSEGNVVIDVHGSTGHMGSIMENDAAITKWAYIARKILELKLKDKLNFRMELKDFDSSENLILEGGQGFLPTHTIGEIQERMRNACVRAFPA